MPMIAAISGAAQVGGQLGSAGIQSRSAKKQREAQIQMMQQQMVQQAAAAQAAQDLIKSGQAEA